MKSAAIIARRRRFAIPGYGYKALADVGFDGEAYRVRRFEQEGLAGCRV